MRFSEFSIKSLVSNAADFSLSFWVPCIVGIIFVVCAVNDFRKGQVRIGILSIVLALGRVGYIFHEEVFALFRMVTN